MAAFASSLIMLKFYDFMRLFNRTAFYVQLLSKTISKIKYFMVLFFVSILIFGLPFSMLTLNRDSNSQLMVPERFGWWFIDTFYN